MFALAGGRRRRRGRASRPKGPRRIGFVKLVAVDLARSVGVTGAALVQAAQDWAFERGAAEVRVGAAPPFYLWPGCDVEHLGALCLFESLGYWTVGAELNMRCSTTHRAAPPPGVRAWCGSESPRSRRCSPSSASEWPNWEAETARGIELGTCFAALAEEDPSMALGYASHSVNRARLGRADGHRLEPPARRRRFGAAGVPV